MAPTALVVGETLIDEYPGERVVAGAPLHVAAHLAELGWRAILVTRVGDDADGEQIVGAARRLGIDTSLIEVDADLPTGTTDITIAGVEHTFRVRFPAAWDHLVGPDPIPQHDALVVGSLPLRHPVGAAAVWRLVAGSMAPLVVDANLRPPHIDLGGLRDLVAAATVVKMNEEEAIALGGMLAGPTWVCTTRGAAGALLTRRDGDSWEVPGEPVPVVDTVGAGDAFLAALVDGLLRGRPPALVLEEANRRAAAVVTRRGGLPVPRHPTRPDASG